MSRRSCMMPAHSVFPKGGSGAKIEAQELLRPQLASQVCWSGYYDLAPSNSPKNPWKKRIPDHSLEALAERHLGILLERSRPDSEGSIAHLYAGQIAHTAWRARVLLPLHAIFQELIEKNCLEKVAELEFATLSPVIEMEIWGIHFDSDAARALIREKETRLVQLFCELQAETKANGYRPPSGEKDTRYYLDPESREEVKEYLHSQGFPVASTKAEVLRELAGRGCHSAGMLLEYRAYPMT